MTLTVEELIKRLQSLLDRGVAKPDTPIWIASESGHSGPAEVSLELFRERPEAELRVIIGERI